MLIKIPAYIKIIIHLHKHPNINIYSIAKGVKLTYAHTSKVIKKMKEEGFIEVSEKNIKEKSVVLTPKGEKLLKGAKLFLEALSQDL